MSRVLKTGKNQITCKYGNGHIGIDLVKYKASLDYIIAHTDGTVVDICKTCNKTYKTGGSYGNYVTIKHDNGMYTHYAHMKYGSVCVNKGQRVSKGQTIGYMGNTGHSCGAHLHFEVRNTSNKQIDPTPYIDADLPSTTKRHVEYRMYSNNDKHWFAVASDGQTAGNLVATAGGVQIRTGAGCGNTKYRVHIKGGTWLSEVTKWDNTSNGYAGIYGKPIDGLAVWSEHGTITYRVHTSKYGWLPWVTGYNIKDNSNGYAGELGNTINGIQIKFK